MTLFFFALFNVCVAVGNKSQNPVHEGEGLFFVLLLALFSFMHTGKKHKPQHLFGSRSVRQKTIGTQNTKNNRLVLFVQLKINSCMWYDNLCFCIVFSCVFKDVFPVFRIG